MNILKKTIKKDFVTIDSVFPQKEPLAFRNAEINEYLNLVQNFDAYTMHPMKPDQDAWFSHGYGVSEEEFKLNKAGYLKHHPKHTERIHYLSETAKYKFKLAYTFFLAETYTLLPYLERHSIPFVFVLYPGGGLGLDNDKSDLMLSKIFRSPCFKMAIVTQQLTLGYLLRKKLCPAGKIQYIYGGFVQFKKAEVKPKRYYKSGKATFDVCFVAAKYSQQGVDKGYDLFIETARLLCAESNDIMFHVVGGFDENDVSLDGIESRVRFYGYRRPDFLLDFYSSMDLFLAPNRPFALYPGNFDGFPLGIDAGYCGAALMVADELKMNCHYVNGEDIIIIPLSPASISECVLRYYNDLDALYALAEAGQKKTQELFDIAHQTGERLKVFSSIIPLTFNRVEATA